MEQQFTVSGMSCGHCVRAVTEAVKEVDLDAGVQVDLGHKSVVVQSGVDRAKLADAITAAGYEVA
jgi:copper chaperone